MTDDLIVISSDSDEDSSCHSEESSDFEDLSAINDSNNNNNDDSRYGAYGSQTYQNYRVLSTDEVYRLMRQEIDKVQEVMPEVS